MSTLLETTERARPTSPIAIGGRIPALDGWRGVAILLVLFDHFQASLLDHFAFPWLQTGLHGVTIFFVLSGFLITSKLVEGDLNLRQFYIRRFFRLMPAAWAYLATLLFLKRMSGGFTTWPEIRACLLFYRNMVDMSGYQMAGHFWSLSLEEQFYLIWPFLLLLAGIRRSRYIAAAGAISCAVYRWYFWPRYDRLGLNFVTQVRADAVLVGCLMALLLSNPRVRLASMRWAKWTAIPALMMLLFCIARFHSLVPLRECASIAVLISTCVLFQGSIWTRLLSWRPLTWLGDVSYSIYLWQGLFVHLGDGAEKLLNICIGLPIFALASYFWIEKPCIRLGHRLSSSTEKGVGSFATGRRGDGDLERPAAPET
jgi:peptidoglycan/LPS O-acetylase OafA/YrhL